MISGTDKRLTAENILKCVSEYDIYRFYLGYDFQYKKLYPSPFRNEERGSFNIIMTYSDKLRHLDFGNSMYKGNCFNFVEQLFAMDFNQALNKINYDMNLGLIPTIKGSASGISIDQVKSKSAPKNVDGTSKTNIRVYTRDFTKEDLEYWKQYGISKEDLIKENIHSVDKLYINGYFIKPKSKEDEMRFAYVFEDVDSPNKDKYIKIYTPNSKNYKWISNIPVAKPFNLRELPKKAKTIIVIKSKKDKMVLSKIYPDIYEVQKEGFECIPDELDSFFDENYDSKFCFFDNDEPGKTANKMLNSKGYGWINIPNEYAAYGIKDASDLIAHFGEEVGYQILKDLLAKKGIVYES